MSVRRQLTLFVPPPQLAPLESIRRSVDPVQQGLIAAHVTLCREDELGDLDVDEIFRRVGSSSIGLVRLVFGAPQRFGGHGLVLPCVEGAEVFQDLRQWLLGDPNARRHEPHVTLAHPRNPRAEGNTDTFAAMVQREWIVEFTTVSLIEQVNGGPWHTQRDEKLGGGGAHRHRGAP